MYFYLGFVNFIVLFYIFMLCTHIGKEKGIQI